MAHVKNPNTIVEQFVADYKKAFGDTLVGVIMYGSAVTHEYRPGRSDINMAIILSDNAIATINSCLEIQKKWSKKKICTPFFMTPEYIKRSLDTYPIEFLDMQNNYRILYGEDVLAELEIKREHLRLQCERELKGAALHLRTEYVRNATSKRALRQLLILSMHRLIPVFKAMIVLGNKTIPASKADIISCIELHYEIGNRVFSEIYHMFTKKLKRGYMDIFENYTKAVDGLIFIIDTMKNEGSE